MHKIILNAEEDAGPYAIATMISDAPIADAELSPGKMKGIDLNDLHVFLAHSHADNLRETVCKIGARVF